MNIAKPNDDDNHRPLQKLSFVHDAEHHHHLRVMMENYRDTARVNHHNKSVLFSIANDRKNLGIGSTLLHHIVCYMQTFRKQGQHQASHRKTSFPRLGLQYTLAFGCNFHHEGLISE